MDAILVRTATDLKPIFVLNSAGSCYVPGGKLPLRDFVFGWLLAEKRNKGVMYQQASCLASQTRFRWDNPKPLKVSGIVLTSAVVSQRRCLLADMNKFISDYLRKID